MNKIVENKDNVMLLSSIKSSKECEKLNCYFTLIKHLIRKPVIYNFSI